MKAVVLKRLNSGSVFARMGQWGAVAHPNGGHELFRYQAGFGWCLDLEDEMPASMADRLLSALGVVPHGSVPPR